LVSGCCGLARYAGGKPGQHQGQQFRVEQGAQRAVRPDGGAAFRAYAVLLENSGDGGQGGFRRAGFYGFRPGGSGALPEYSGHRT